jgi:DNA-binding transcriptional ArsR family regulator
MDVLGMAQSRVSRHLAILREAGSCAIRRDGTYVFYRFDPPAEGRGARRGSSCAATSTAIPRARATSRRSRR